MAGLVDLGILVIVLIGIIAVSDEPLTYRRLGFLLLLVTLLITLYDRYRPEYVARFALSEPVGGVQPRG